LRIVLKFIAAIDNHDSTSMMIIRIIARAISRKPVWSFEWWP
jgi:hypothetical protein